MLGVASRNSACNITQHPDATLRNTLRQALSVAAQHVPCSFGSGLVDALLLLDATAIEYRNMLRGARRNGPLLRGEFFYVLRNVLRGGPCASAWCSMQQLGGRIATCCCVGESLRNVLRATP